jgi:hypothetical protein
MAGLREHDGCPSQGCVCRVSRWGPLRSSPSCSVLQPTSSNGSALRPSPFHGVAMRNFNPSSKHPDRAVQAWQILVGAAMHRQTLTYEGLSVLMYQKKAAGVLDNVLGHVAFYCISNDLPPLTSIVVGKNRGTPGEEIPFDRGFNRSTQRFVGTALPAFHSLASSVAARSTGARRHPVRPARHPPG